jgi:hypothetical protein
MKVDFYIYTYGKPTIWQNIERLMEFVKGITILLPTSNYNRTQSKVGFSIVRQRTTPKAHKNPKPVTERW